MEDTVRKEAFYTLLENDMNSSERMERAFSDHPDWDERDRAFYTALVDTTLSRLVTIDAVIGAYSRTRIGKLSAVVRTGLEIGLAQILFMDRVPDSAACNESVKLVKIGGDGRYSGFVNGILRNIIRHKDALQAKTVIDGKPVWLTYTDQENGWRAEGNVSDQILNAAGLSITYSYPLWIVRHLIRSYKNARQILAGLSMKRRRFAFSAIDTSDLIERLAGEGVGAAALPGEDAPAVFFESGGNPADTKAFRQGLFYIMDRSSMEPVLRAELREKSRILDLCASPGGKSIEAALMYKASLLSCDVSENKTKRIYQNISRMHVEDRVEVRVNDARVLCRDLCGKFDAVIADVPCSALGVSGRKPQIRQRVKESDFSVLSGIQREILDNAAEYLKTGGLLIYSTCTLDPAENEDQVSAFLERRRDFTLKEQRTIIPDQYHDGFFYAIIIKKRDSTEG